MNPIKTNTPIEESKKKRKYTKRSFSKRKKTSENNEPTTILKTTTCKTVKSKVDSNIETKPSKQKKRKVITTQTEPAFLEPSGGVSNNETPTKVFAEGSNSLVIHQITDSRTKNNDTNSGKDTFSTKSLAKPSFSKSSLENTSREKTGKGRRKKQTISSKPIEIETPLSETLSSTTSSCSTTHRDPTPLFDVLSNKVEPSDSKDNGEEKENKKKVVRNGKKSTKTKTNTVVLNDDKDTNKMRETTPKKRKRKTPAVVLSTAEKEEKKGMKDEDKGVVSQTNKKKKKKSSKNKNKWWLRFRKTQELTNNHHASKATNETMNNVNLARQSSVDPGIRDNDDDTTKTSINGLKSSEKSSFEKSSFEKSSFEKPYNDSASLGFQTTFSNEEVTSAQNAFQPLSDTTQETTGFQTTESSWKTERKKQREKEKEEKSIRTFYGNAIDSDHLLSQENGQKRESFYKEINECRMKRDKIVEIALSGTTDLEKSNRLLDDYMNVIVNILKGYPKHLVSNRVIDAFEWVQTQGDRGQKIASIFFMLFCDMTFASAHFLSLPTEYTDPNTKARIECYALQNVVPQTFNYFYMNVLNHLTRKLLNCKENFQAVVEEYAIDCLTEYVIIDTLKI